MHIGINCNWYVGEGGYQGNLACFVRSDNIFDDKCIVIPSRTESKRPIVGHKTNLTINGNNNVVVFSIDAPATKSAPDDVYQFTGDIDKKYPKDNIFVAGDFNVEPKNLAHLGALD